MHQDIRMCFSLWYTTYDDSFLEGAIICLLLFLCNELKLQHNSQIICERNLEQVCGVHYKLMLTTRLVRIVCTVQ
jgi:hypothetical protein